MANKEPLIYPLPPWSLADSNDGEPGLITRYGAEKAEEIYCRLATELGYFNPKTEPTAYRPALDCTPHLAKIREQNAKKPAEGGK